MKKCECGCGREVSKEGNNYIHGHYNKGKKFSEEHRRKISNAKKGKKFSEEHRRKIRESLKGCEKTNNTNIETSNKTTEYKVFYKTWNLFNGKED